MTVVETFDIDGVPYILALNMTVDRKHFTMYICDEAFLQTPVSEEWSCNSELVAIISNFVGIEIDAKLITKVCPGIHATPGIQK